MSYDVRIFAHDSYYKSWVARMPLIRRHDRVYGFGSIKEAVRSGRVRVS